MDPADDPPVSSNYSDSAVGNTIRSYIYSAIGAFLYPKYGVCVLSSMPATPTRAYPPRAHTGLMEQAATVAADYGIPPTTPFVGAQSGGIEAEGVWEHMQAPTSSPMHIGSRTHRHAIRRIHGVRDDAVGGHAHGGLGQRGAQRAADEADQLHILDGLRQRVLALSPAQPPHHDRV